MKFALTILAAALLMACVPTHAQVYTGGYVGIFFNLSVKADLKADFYSTNILSTADDSSKVGSYDHVTIFFQPNQTQLTNDYNPRFGAIQSVHILGYAMDEHGQAILVSIDGPNAIQSGNSFPHVTISSSNSPGYSAVYSNDLWARIAASGFVNITNDQYGKPSTIAWTDSSLIINNTYQFTLPEYTGISKYNSTLVNITLFEPSIGGLEGIFCASRQWNGTSGVCNTAPINLPTPTPPTPPLVYKGGYVGVFYNLTVKAALRDTFLSTNILGTADNSSKVGAYDHTTIYFEPNQLHFDNEYNRRLGEKQSAHILGYAMDEHGQALLLSYDGPNAIQTSNAFPHVTISSSNNGPYSAVYSNDLWARVAASGYVTITNDAYGKPATITWNLTTITDSSLIINNTYQFTLPEYTGIAKYNSTLVQVTLFEPSIGELEGIFCANRQWNGKTGVCDKTPVIITVPTTATPTTPTPTTPTPTTTPSSNSSSSSSSSSTGSGSSSTILPPSSSTSVPSSSSVLTSSFTIVSTGIVSAFIALFFL